MPRKKQQTTVPEQEKVRCVIYTRKSVDDGLEQEFNSLDAQRQAAECFIESQKFKGWVLDKKRYDDGGYSGGTLARPAMQELLQDAAEGKFDVIVVYKIDRLSRSIVDFAELIKKFDAYGVSFVSVTQDINTSTSSGRMMLNILMTFAQYEREIIAERIKDKMSASRKLGKWVGGSVPFGYKVVNKRLVVDEHEAPVVVRIFKEYATTGRIKDIAYRLREENFKRSNGKELHIPTIRSLLKNQTYIGNVVYDGNVYKGEHEPIISKELWDKAQQVCSDKHIYKIEHEGNNEPTNLYSGIIRCGHCDSSMITVSGRNNNRIYRYLICNKEQRNSTGKCPLKRIPQGEVEALIFNQIKTIVQSPSFTMMVAEMLGIQTHIVATQLGNFLQMWSKLEPTEKRKIITIVIEKVVIYTEHIEIEIKSNNSTKLMEEIADVYNNY